MLSSVVRALKALIVTLLGLVRRVLCFLNRSKKDKNDYEPILATSSMGNSDSNSTEWDSWNDGFEVVVTGGSNSRKKIEPETVADHISAYRQSLQEARLQKQQQQEDLEKEQKERQDRDLLAQLEPQVKQQRKVFVGSSGGKKQRKSSASRLGVQEEASDPILSMGNDLADWDQGGSGGAAGGWEEEDLSEEIREQRRKNRNRLSSH